VFRDKKFAKELPVKHQRMAGSNLGDHKTFFAGDALKADGAKNTSDQFESKKMNQNVNLFKKNNFYY
jgi:hypothetical protein